MTYLVAWLVGIPVMWLVAFAWDWDERTMVYGSLLWPLWAVVMAGLYALLWMVDLLDGVVRLFRRLRREVPRA